jgi:hypothetical protein
MTMDKLPSRLAEHPTVRKVASRRTGKPGVIDADWLRQVCLEAGADDVAFASVDNPELASEREHVEGALPGTRSFISLVVKMNRDNVRSPARSVANQEFHRSGELINEAAHRITRTLQEAGYRALNPSATFPMEMDNFPGRIWVAARMASRWITRRAWNASSALPPARSALKPLQDKKETLYVLPNSAAKEHAERRYPHKRVKVVDSGIHGR